jgi:hypothetical protein
LVLPSKKLLEPFFWHARDGQRAQLS